MKKQLTKKEKIVRWASEQKTRGISHAMTELNYSDEKALKFMLNRLKRQGLITYNMVGRKVELHLTQTAYYNRGSLVNAR